jgi:hypothetical protein
MIVLFNLNSYIGGGETLLVRFADYLHVRSLRYEIIAFDVNGWIFKEAIRRDFPVKLWPNRSDSVVYQNKADVRMLQDYFSSTYEGEKILRIFTFCMRDLYNAMTVFSTLKDTVVYHSHGIYHPDDFMYLSSFSFRKKKFIDSNRLLLTKLYESDSLLFMNMIGLSKTFAVSVESAYKLYKRSICIPIPINIPNSDSVLSVNNKVNQPLRIICISRFVKFKIAAVLGIMRYVACNKNAELTLVGHGRFSILIRLWIFFNRSANIKLLSGIEPDQLDPLIDGCDIGFAQGTAILEIAKRKLPVIIAPYSRLSGIFKKEFRCLGVFGKANYDYEFGDLYDLSGCETFTIAESINMVANNYLSFKECSYKRALNFRSDIIFLEMVSFIENSQFLNSTLQLPSPPVIKKMIKKVLDLY